MPILVVTITKLHRLLEAASQQSSPLSTAGDFLASSQLLVVGQQPLALFGLDEHHSSLGSLSPVTLLASLLLHALLQGM